MSDQPISPEAEQVSKLLTALRSDKERFPFSTLAIAEALLKERPIDVEELIRHHLRPGVVAGLLQQLAAEVVKQR